MKTSQTVPPSAKTIRLIHASLIMGTVLFAGVTHFLLGPAMVDLAEFTPALVRVLLGVAVALCAIALLFRQRVPRKSSDESGDRFWMRAIAPAMVTWTLVDGAGLLAAFAYGKSRDAAAIGVAAISVFFLVALNPRYFERR